MKSSDDHKVVVLDRDGVINEYPGDYQYVKSCFEFKILPNVKEAIRLLNDNGFRVFVASNQAGVTKGVYSQETLDEITEFMHCELGKIGAKINEVFYCIHTDEYACECRKPKTGMLKKAIGNPGESTYFIGDTLRDVQTARNFGCKSILVLSGKIKNKEEIINWSEKPNFIAKDLLEAVQEILNKKV